MTESPGPIFVLGVARRSGTNLLAALLCCHADCAPPADPLREDNLVREAKLLVEYSHRVAGRWAPRWGPSDDARATLLRSLGAGVERFVGETAPGRRVVTKTPTPSGLRVAYEVLPSATLIVLVRDGRAVTASLRRGFRLSLDRAAREWRDGARTIQAFIDRHGPTGDRHVLVRYEDLVERRNDTLRSVLQVCGLSEAGFDWRAAADVPVVGSSYTGRPGRVDWIAEERNRKIERPAEPLVGRRLRRFTWIAGDEQSSLGYPVGPTGEAALKDRALDLMWPLRALDVRAHLRKARGRVARRVLS